jgi:hypothetical protein
LPIRGRLHTGAFSVFREVSPLSENDHRLRHNQRGQKPGAPVVRRSRFFILPESRNRL